MAGKLMRLLSLACLFNILTTVYACSPINWVRLSMEELLYKSDIVVLGTDIAHFPVPEEGMRLDSVFEVKCVLKHDGWPVQEDIFIERIRTGNSCSGTDGKINVGDTVIAALTRTDSGNYRWHEVNVMQSAVWKETPANIRKAASVCGLEYWNEPVGSNITTTWYDRGCAEKHPMVLRSCTKSGTTRSMFVTTWFILSLAVFASVSRKWIS